MHNDRSNTRLLPLLLAGIVAGSATPALTANYSQDDIYADSFGNLIVESAAGYKRIIVGQGHQVRKLARYMRGESSQDGAPGPGGYDGYGLDCFQPPVLVRGRSYMYGFYQGVIPLQGGPCR